MTDERPRPQYGEYATPEQQARAAGHQFDPKAAARAIQEAQAAQAAQAERAIPHPAKAPPAVDSRVPKQSPFRSTVLVRHPIDRFFTVFMLGIGIFSLIYSVPSLLSFAATFDSAYARSGVGKFPEPDLANQVGIWILVANSVLLMLTVAWAFRRISRGKPASFVPVIGFVLFFAVFYVAFLVMEGAEPTYFRELIAAVLGTTA